MGVDVVGQVGGVEDREDVPADRRLEDGEVLHLPEEAHGHPRAPREMGAPARNAGMRR